MYAGDSRMGRCTTLMMGLVFLTLSAVGGCQKTPSKSASNARERERGLNRHGDDLFRNAIGQLNHLEQFPDSRETLRGIVGRLDQWIQNQEPLPGWTPSSSIESMRAAAIDAASACDAVNAAIMPTRNAAEPGRVLEHATRLLESLRSAADATHRLAELTDSMLFENLAATLDATAASLAQKTAALPVVGPQQTVAAVQDWLTPLPPGYYTQLSETLKAFADRLDIAKLDFDSNDAEPLEQAVWLRDIARWAPGDALDDLDRVVAVFDWTVRNVQLVPDQTRDPATGTIQIRPLQRPWETLLLGQGTATDRGWMFVLLLRQLGIDAAFLNVKNDDATAGLRALAVGVLLDDDLYLFDPGLGIPIPSVHGIVLSDEGLKIRPATLAEAVADDRVFRQLDGFVAGGSFPMRSEQLRRVVAVIVVSPSELSQRMALLQSQLTGQNKIVLASSCERQMERFQAIPAIESTVVWTRPVNVLVQNLLAPDALGSELFIYRVGWALGPPAWEDAYVEAEDDGRNFGNVDQMKPGQKPEDPVRYLREPDTLAAVSPMWKGKACYFAGAFTGQQSAAAYFQQARISDRQLRELPQDTRDDRERIASLLEMKAAASYSLGLMSAEQGYAAPIRDAIENKRREGFFKTAIDYLENRVVAMNIQGDLVPGAIYNLGRIHEAQADYPRAIAWYRLDIGSANSGGNHVRAMLLERYAMTADAAEEAVPPIEGGDVAPFDEDATEREQPEPPEAAEPVVTPPTEPLPTETPPEQPHLEAGADAATPPPQDSPATPEYTPEEAPEEAPEETPEKIPTF